MEELIWKVAVGEVKFDSIKPSPVDGLVGGGGVPLGIRLDFVDFQGTGGRVGRGDGDGGCSYEFKVGVFGIEQFDFRSSTEGPKLEEDVRAISVYCIYNL